LVLALAAIWLRDPRLFVGWGAFAPYWLVNFLAKEAVNPQLISYKPFPFILTMVWPALIALADPTPNRRSLGIVQAAVLASALIAVNDQGIEFLPPLGPAHFAEAWLPQPETAAAPIYRAFEARLRDNTSARSAPAAGPWRSTRTAFRCGGNRRRCPITSAN
jgi:hypothetical protein